MVSVAVCQRLPYNTTDGCAGKQNVSHQGRLIPAAEHETDEQLKEGARTMHLVPY